MFWFFFFFFCHRHMGILASQPEIKSASPALKGKVLTTGPLGKSSTLSSGEFSVQQRVNAKSNNFLHLQQNWSSKQVRNEIEFDILMHFCCTASNLYQFIIFSFTQNSQYILHLNYLENRWNILQWTKKVALGIRKKLEMKKEEFIIFPVYSTNLGTPPTLE